MKILLSIFGLYLFLVYVVAFIMGITNKLCNKNWDDEEIYCYSVLWPIVGILIIIDLILKLIDSLRLNHYFDVVIKKISVIVEIVTIPFHPYKMGMKVASLFQRRKKSS